LTSIQRSQIIGESGVNAADEQAFLYSGGTEALSKGDIKGYIEN
jgi:hypothetical protein